MNSPTPNDTQEPAIAPAVEKKGGHPFQTGMWMLGAVLVYYALQAWILPAAGVQT
ncbi:MAG: hypothetical protein ACI9R3_003571 [Verrucomicrobiales bacterium]|jgi:hypothetical protein